MLAERWFGQIVATLAEEGVQRGLRAREGMERSLDALAAMASQVELGKPMEAAPWVRPTGTLGLPELRDQLSQSRQALLDLLPALDQLDTDQLRYEHPTQHFVLNAYQWVHLSGVHDRLHTRQIRQALEAGA